MLSATDPVAFSPYILNAVYRAAAKQAHIEALCTNLEFVTGVDRDSAMVGDLGHIPSLASWLAAWRPRFDGDR